MLRPGVVGAHVPGVAFRVFDGELAAAVAVGGVVERCSDIGSGGHGAVMGCVGVGDDDVETAGLDAAQSRA